MATGRVMQCFSSSLRRIGGLLSVWIVCEFVDLVRRVHRKDSFRGSGPVATLC